MNIYDLLLGNTIYCVILLQLWIMVSLIMLVVSLVLWFKTKKGYWIALVLFSLFGAYQIIPHFYEVKAVTSSNEDVFVQNYEKAIKTSILPMQKAMMCSMLAGHYGSKNLPLAIEYYKKTYKYAKNYESKYLWLTASLTYYLKGDFDKVIEIEDALGVNMFKPSVYVIKRDFEKALISINKDLENHPNSWKAFGVRANIYRNLGKETEAREDYHKALSLCKNEDSRNIVNEYYKNKFAIMDEWIWKRASFKEKGGIL